MSWLRLISIIIQSLLSTIALFTLLSHIIKNIFYFLTRSVSIFSIVRGVLPINGKVLPRTFTTTCKNSLFSLLSLSLSYSRRIHFGHYKFLCTFFIMLMQLSRIDLSPSSLEFKCSVILFCNAYCLNIESNLNSIS